jgi:hypothetical protein
MVEFNAGLVARGGDEIAFQPHGPAIPHCTLLMGVVQDERAFSAITDRLPQAVSGLMPVSWRLAPPHFVSARAGFVFSDVIDANEVIGDRLMIEEAVGDYMRTVPHGGVHNPPHVTLGYIKSHELPPTPAWPAGGLTVVRDRVELSTVGPRGSCIDVLASWSLPSDAAMS